MKEFLSRSIFLMRSVSMVAGLSGLIFSLLELRENGPTLLSLGYIGFAGAGCMYILRSSFWETHR